MTTTVPFGVAILQTEEAATLFPLFAWLTFAIIEMFILLMDFALATLKWLEDRCFAFVTNIVRRGAHLPSVVQVFYYAMC